jgi:hypothetical protein
MLLHTLRKFRLGAFVIPERCVAGNAADAERFCDESVQSQRLNAPARRVGRGEWGYTGLRLFNTER